MTKIIQWAQEEADRIKAQNFLDKESQKVGSGHDMHKFSDAANNDALPSSVKMNNLHNVGDGLDMQEFPKAANNEAQNSFDKVGRGNNKHVPKIGTRHNAVDVAPTSNSKSSNVDNLCVANRSLSLKPNRSLVAVNDTSSATNKNFYSVSVAKPKRDNKTKAATQSLKDVNAILGGSPLAAGSINHLATTAEFTQNANRDVTPPPNHIVLATIVRNTTLHKPSLSFRVQNLEAFVFGSP